ASTVPPPPRRPGYPEPNTRRQKQRANLSRAERTTTWMSAPRIGFLGACAVAPRPALLRDDWIKQGTALVPAPYRRSSTGDHKRPRPRPFGGRFVNNYTILSPHMQ